MRKSLILLAALLVFSTFMYVQPPTYANFNLNFHIDSDSLPPALQDIIKSISGLQRIVVSGSFNGQSSHNWYFSGSLTVETTHGTAFDGSLSITYNNGIVDWSLKFGSSIKIKIWSLGTKRFDVAFKKIPFIKHIDVGADVYLEMGGVGGLTNGVGEADVFIGLSAEAVLGFFKDKAVTSDASIDAHVDGKLHLVISYDGKYLRVGWYPEVGARAVFRFGKWISWNWGDRWIPKKIPWWLKEWDLSTGSSSNKQYTPEDVPIDVYNSSDYGGSKNIYLTDASNNINMPTDVGAISKYVDNKLVAYPIYGSATINGQVKKGDEDYYRFTVYPYGSAIIYLVSQNADYDLYIYSPNGDFYAKSIRGGESVDAIVIPSTTLESWGNTVIVCVKHYSGDGVYTINVGYTNEDNNVYSPPTTIIGTIAGDGTSGPHYNNPDSKAWREIKVRMRSNVEYKLTLDWTGDLDLDIYVYAPGTAPSIDGSGTDYKEKSATSGKPEEIIFIADTDGTWIVAIDFYSRSGMTNYTLKIEVINNNSQNSNEVYNPPITINGTIEGGSTGPHYNNPDSASWVEYRVNLEANQKYIVKLTWDSSSDLDLYVYSPGRAPSIDGTGSDYYNASAKVNRNYEVIYLVPNETGVWIIGIDHYSEYGSANYLLTINPINTNNNQNNNTSSGEYTIEGSVTGDDIGPHYDNPSSPAWQEHTVTLQSGHTYKIILEWSSYADLDLYVYSPGKAPSIDGTGNDYYAKAYTTNNPEILKLSVDQDGSWVIAVDKYRGSGTTSYAIHIIDLTQTNNTKIEFKGTVAGVGTYGPHYSGNGWKEYRVYLINGQKYRITLSWSGSSDLDLYVYSPGKAPSIDGTGNDYYARAYTTSKPEVLEFTVHESGYWVIAVDHYSKSGSASFTIIVEPASNTRFLTNLNTYLDKDRYTASSDLDGDGIPDIYEDIPIFTDPKNPLIPAIYPPLIVVLYILWVYRKKIFSFRLNLIKQKKKYQVVNN